MRQLSVCFSIALIAFCYFFSPARSMEISISESGDSILARGEIVPGDAPKLRRLLADGAFAGKWFAISSDGGSVLAALEMGRLVRSWGMTTYVPSKADCFSACLLVFVGGKDRRLGDGARIGSHQFRWSDDDLEAAARRASDAQELSGKILQHFISLGVSPEALVAVMQVPPDQMHVFSRFEAERYTIVGSSPPEARSPVVLGGDERRVGCPFSDDFVLSDPLNLYPSCH